MGTPRGGDLPKIDPDQAIGELRGVVASMVLCALTEAKRDAGTNENPAPSSEQTPLHLRASVVARTSGFAS
jgi:hypothetical protein